MKPEARPDQFWKHRNLIALDFDGVIHDYDKWTGVVPDGPPLEGALEFVEYLIEKGYDLCIYSGRAHYDGGTEAIEEWMDRHGFPEMPIKEKLPYALLIDDRTLRFDGVFEDVKNWLDENSDLPRWGEK